MVTGSGGGGIVFTMRLDPATWDRYFGGGVGGGRGGGGTTGGGPGLFGAMFGGGSSTPAERTARDRSNQSNFLQQLLIFSGIQKLLGTVVQQGSVSASYLGSMGKVFGAAMDLLMIPLMPVLNLIMIGMVMLVKWLVQSGTLNSMLKTMQDLAGNIMKFVGWVQDVFNTFKSEGFWSGMGKVIGDAIKELWQNPKNYGTALKEAAVAGVGLGALNVTAAAPILTAMALMGAGKWAIGGGLGLAGRGIGAGARGIGGLFGGGAGAAAGEVTDTEIMAAMLGTGGATAGGGAGGGLLGILGTIAPWLLAGGVGIGAGAGAGWLASKAGGAVGMHGIPLNMITGGVAGGAGVGAGIGALAGLGVMDWATVPIGAGIGAGVGGAAGLIKGLIDMHNQSTGGAQVPAAGNQQNSNNTIHLTQYNYNVQDPKKLASDFNQELQRSSGYTLAAGSYAG